MCGGQEQNGDAGECGGVGDLDLRFSTPVAIIVFILISGFEILGVFFLDLRVGHVITDAGVKFVKGLPLELVPFLGEVSGCGYGSLEG